MWGAVRIVITLAVLAAVFVGISTYLESTSMPSSVQRASNRLKDAEAFEASRMRTSTRGAGSS